MNKYLNLNELIILKTSINSVYIINDRTKFKIVVGIKEPDDIHYVAATFDTEQEALNYKDKIFEMLSPIKGPSVSYGMLSHFKVPEKTEFDVSTAIWLMKKGYKVRRKTWSENCYIFLVGNEILDETGATNVSVLVRNIHENNWEIYEEEKNNE